MKRFLMLNKTDEFSSVFSFKRRVSATFLTIHYLPHEEVSLRVGLVVAKRIAKRAVDRNYMRRVLKKILWQQTQITNQVDMVIRVNRLFTNKQYKAIDDEINLLLANMRQKIARVR